MKKLAIYVALMEEQKKLQNIFMMFNAILLIGSIVLLVLKFFKLSDVSFFVFVIPALLFLVLQSRFVLNICNKTADRQFKKLYLDYLEAGTYYQTEKRCRNFRKVRKNVLIGFIKDRRRMIKKSFAYLEEWQDNNLMEIEL